MKPFHTRRHFLAQSGFGPGSVALAWLLAFKQAPSAYPI